MTGVPRHRNRAQIKEQIKTPEIKQCNEKIGNLSDAEFKTIVVSMSTQLIELSCKMRGQMKSTQSEIKQNIEAHSEGKETSTQINDLEKKEEVNIQPE